MAANRHGAFYGENYDLELDGGDVQLCEYTKNHWILHFE